MKSGIVIVGIGLGISFAACTADLRDNSVCVMYARALCNKASSCGLLNNQSADQCLAPYLEDACKTWENSSSDPDPRKCGAAIDGAPCPDATPVSLPDCNRNLSKADLVSIGKPGSSGWGGSATTGGSGGTGASGGSGGSSATGGSGGVGGTKGGAGGVGGTTGGSGGVGGTTGGSGGVGGTTGGSGGVGGTTGGSAGVGGTTGGTGGSGGTTGGAGGTGGVPPTATCTSYLPDTTYPCVMTVPSGCGTNPVSCGNNMFCVANSTCVTAGCQCFSGYLAVSCATGLRCSGCAASTWGCTARPDPGCTGNPSQTAGVCTCSNGRTFNLACGSTVTCDQRCRQGS